MNTTKARPLSPMAQRGAFSKLLSKHALQIAIVLVALLIWAFFLWRAPSTWLGYAMYNSLMLTTPFFGLVAIPLTLVIIAKEIDLSFPSVMAWGMAAFDVVFVATGSVELGFVACLLAGLFAGWLNGFIIVRFGVPSLVVTLGTQFFWQGVVLTVTNGQGLGMVAVQNSFLYPLLVGKLFGVIPMQFIWMIIVAVITWFFLNRHKYGAHVYLIGDNVESARLMGVNVGRQDVDLCHCRPGGCFYWLCGQHPTALLLADTGPEHSDVHARFGLPGRHIRIWRHRHHLRHVRRLLYYQRYQPRHCGCWMDSLFDPVDQWSHHRCLGIAAGHDTPPILILG